MEKYTVVIRQKRGLFFRRWVRDHTMPPEYASSYEGARRWATVKNSNLGARNGIWRYIIISIDKV